MQFDLNNPMLIIVIVLAGVAFFNIALFGFAKRISKRNNSHPMQTLAQTVNNFRKGGNSLTNEASELNEIMTKINQDQNNAAEEQN